MLGCRRPVRRGRGDGIGRGMLRLLQGYLPYPAAQAAVHSSITDMGSGGRKA